MGRDEIAARSSNGAAPFMDAPSSETSIRQALDRGDLRRASELLVMHHADAVYATCRALVRERTLAEDLSQEAFTKAIAALRTFRGEAQVRTWLLSITRNTCLDHLRRTRGPSTSGTRSTWRSNPARWPRPSSSWCSAAMWSGVSRC